MLSSVFEPTVAQTLERISPDLVHLEQYMDFVRTRQFRQTLLCHAPLRPKRALDPSFMDGLMLSSRAVTESGPPDLRPEHPVVFHNRSQRATVTLPASKAAFSVLMQAWPRAVDCSELRAAALELAAPHITDLADAGRTLMGDLLQSVLYGMARLHTIQVNCTNRLSETPRAHPITSYLASQCPIVVNAHHEMVKLEPLSVEVVKLADGRRSREEILEALLARVVGGALPITVENERELTEGAMRRRLERELELALSSLVRNAIIVA
jgi:methyltransferase-like protein